MGQDSIFENFRGGVAGFGGEPGMENAAITAVRSLLKSPCQAGGRTDMNEYTPDIYLDIPVPYAVFEVLLNEDRTDVVNTRYLYVNLEYCKLAGKSREELVGKLFLDVFPERNKKWFTYCYNAVKYGKNIHDVIYSNEVKHWLDFTIGPISREGFIAYAFMYADEEHARKVLLARERLSDNISLNISKILNHEGHYQNTIEQALRELANWIEAERLYILETDGKTVSNTFEWCQKGIEPQIATLQDKAYEPYIGGWEKFLEVDNSVVLDDIEILREDDPVDYENLKRQGIQRLIAAPFYENGKLIGYLGADNYKVSEFIDTKKILETISYFLGIKIINHRLMKRLENLSYYDELTGVRNRHSLQKTMEKLAGEDVSLGVIYADVNGLKCVNDLGGHSAGDAFLKRAAELILRHVDRKSVYREGGDEFVVVLPKITEGDFRKIEWAMRESIRDSGEVHIALGFSWSAHSFRIRELIREADEAMYSDKAEYYSKNDRRRKP